MPEKTNGNESTTRWVLVVWIGLLLVVLGALSANTLALGAAKERVARLEAQYDIIRDDLKDIKRALGVTVRP